MGCSSTNDIARRVPPALQTHLCPHIQGDRQETSEASSVEELRGITSVRLFGCFDKHPEILNPKPQTANHSPSAPKVAASLIFVSEGQGFRV
mmetsp:Transcript_32234/g.50260  ORF Transcript_32234/g.50260 Transcript_32234/m.50260 type:complete len:92 (+) Transcript_32234:589-864(+)